MNYLVIYEFDGTLDSRNFNNEEAAKLFVQDKNQEVCQDGGFVKYYVISGNFSVQAGFIDRVEKK